MDTIRLRHLAAVLVPGVAWSCLTGPPDGLPHAAATSSCGPTDGPAVVVYLASAPIAALEPAPPFVRIAVWESMATIAHRTFDLSVDGGIGNVNRMGPGSVSEPGAGTLSVTTIRADSTIVGSVDLWFASGRVRGDFRAAWHARSLLCG